MIAPILLERYYTKRTVDDLIFYTHGNKYYDHLLAIAGRFCNFDYSKIKFQEIWSMGSNQRISKKDDWFYIAVVLEYVADDFHLAFHENDIDQMKNYFNKLLELGCFA